MSNVTVEKEVIRVEGVNPKSKYPKFNSGSVLTDKEEWFNVSKKIDIREFQRGNAYTVEVETNEKGYKTIVGVSNPEGAIETTKSSKGVSKEDQDKTTSKYDAKDRRISRQGVIQAAVQSLFVTDFESAKVLADQMLEYVNETTSN